MGRCIARTLWFGSFVRSLVRESCRLVNLAVNIDSQSVKWCGDNFLKGESTINPTQKIVVWSCWLAKKKRPPWLATLAMCTILGLVTLAFGMTEDNMNAAFSKVQHRIDHGSWEQTINRRWLRPDLASVLVGVVFFSLLWLLPVVIVVHYAGDGRRALLCLTAICMWASALVLVVAVGSFTVLYFTTKEVENAFSWSSAFSAYIAACILVFCSVLFLLCRGLTAKIGVVQKTKNNN